jgi:hypothetical protein
MEGKEGVKFDLGKPPLSLLPRAALEAEAMVLAYGAKKYGTHNWRLGMDHSRLLDACLRHIVAYAAGEDIDPESGLPHLAHARCSLGFLLHYRAAGVGTDDRAAGRAVAAETKEPFGDVCCRAGLAVKLASGSYAFKSVTPEALLEFFKLMRIREGL